MRALNTSPVQSFFVVGRNARPTATSLTPQRPAHFLNTTTPLIVPLQRCQAEQQSSSSSSSSPTTAATTTAPPAPFTYTSYEGNSFRAEFTASNVKILVDPWLVGNLTFGGLDFIYSGTKKVARPDTINIDVLAADTDFILLTMSIDDHAHRPTLERLPKSLPVVGSPSAAAVARQLGYTTVYELGHGQEMTLTLNKGGGEKKISIRATQGALVGPPWSKRENGFVLREICTAGGGTSLYYEPHADYVSESVAEVSPVDIVVSPPCTQSLLGYQLVKGASENISLLKMLRPKVVVPLMNAEFDATGPLNSLLTENGGVDALKQQLEMVPELKEVKVLVPTAGVPLAVNF